MRALPVKVGKAVPAVLPELAVPVTQTALAGVLTMVGRQRMLLDFQVRMAKEDPAARRTGDLPAIPIAQR